MPQSDNVQIVKSFIQMAQSEGMKAAVLKWCGPHFTWWVAGIGAIEGRYEEFFRVIEENLEGNGMRLDLAGFTTEGERVAVEARSHATLKNGAQYQNAYHFLFIIRNQKIEAIREYHDTAHAAAVWGALMGKLQQQA